MYNIVKAFTKCTNVNHKFCKKPAFCWSCKAKKCSYMYILKSTVRYYIQTPVHVDFTLFRTNLICPAFFGEKKSYTLSWTFIFTSAAPTFRGNLNIHYKDCVRCTYAAICKHGLDLFRVDAGADVVTVQLKENIHVEKKCLANAYRNKCDRRRTLPIWIVYSASVQWKNK